MEHNFRLPFANKRGKPSENISNLVQILLMLSSGILSSSAIAAVLKAWLDNRKTKLTIQIEGERKTLQYEGPHLNQDAATIQTVFAKLDEDTKVVLPIDRVTIELTYDEQQEEAVLQSLRQQENITADHREQAIPLQPSPLLQRLLPAWLHRQPPSIESELRA